MASSDFHVLNLSALRSRGDKGEGIWQRAHTGGEAAEELSVGFDVDAVVGAALLRQVA